MTVVLVLSPVLFSLFSSRSRKLSKTNQKNSKELYLEAAQMLGMSCEFTENCRCLDCQVTNIAVLFDFFGLCVFSKTSSRKAFWTNHWPLRVFAPHFLRQNTQIHNQWSRVTIELKIPQLIMLSFLTPSEPIFWLWRWRWFRHVFKSLIRHGEWGIRYTRRKRWNTLLL